MTSFTCIHTNGVYQQYKGNICNRAFKCGSELPEYVALILRNGGSQSPDRWLRELRNNQSELIQIKIEHVEIGYFDLYTKGGKLRRLYIPKMLRNETLEWLNEANRTSGYLFLNRYGDKITPRGISQQLKNYADKYGLDKKVVYPHSFRHRYAKNFLEKFNDIALLADLMGHESIETTRIYLRRTASEQQALVDKIVTW